MRRNDSLRGVVFPRMKRETMKQRGAIGLNLFIEGRQHVGTVEYSPLHMVLCSVR